jgi:hypothetical protein
MYYKLICILYALLCGQKKNYSCKKWVLHFALVLSFSYSFRDFATFRAFCWLLRFSFFEMNFLSFSWLFGLPVVLHGVLDSNFKLCAFVVNGLIKGEIEKPCGQSLGLIVMSH